MMSKGGGGKMAMRMKDFKEKTSKTETNNKMSAILKSRMRKIKKKKPLQICLEIFLNEKMYFYFIFSDPSAPKGFTFTKLCP